MTTENTDTLTVLPSVTHGVWRIHVPDPDVHDMLGTEYVLTAYPLTVSGDEVRQKVKRVNSWCLVHLVRLDGSTFMDELSLASGGE